jgi:hypothetical protein
MCTYLTPSRFALTTFSVFCNLLNPSDEWDMAAEICLSKLPHLIADQNAEFQVFY